LAVYAVERRPRGDRLFAYEVRSDMRTHPVIWRTFTPQGGWTCAGGVKHTGVWMHKAGNTRIYTCEHESQIHFEPTLLELPPGGR
jgi:hypothetical protein